MEPGLTGSQSKRDSKVLRKVAPLGRGDLYLLFYVGKQRFACDVEEIEEVIPQVELERVERKNSLSYGLLQYRKDLVPILDFSYLVAKRISSAKLSTRIIIACSKAGEEKRFFGLIAEGVLELLEARRSDFVTSSFSWKKEDFIEGVFHAESGLIELVSLQKLYSHMHHHLQDP